MGRAWFEELSLDASALGVGEVNDEAPGVAIAARFCSYSESWIAGYRKEWATHLNLGVFLCVSAFQFWEH